MDYTELTDQLNYLHQMAQGDIRQIAADSKTDTVTRIAAILLSVMVLEDPISFAATEVIFGLTDPDLYDVDPMTSQDGIQIQELAKLDKGQLTQIVNNEENRVKHAIARFILAIDADEPFDNPSFALILRTATGKDPRWWRGWVIRHRR